jgi:hypothetical protein
VGSRYKSIAATPSHRHPLCVMMSLVGFRVLLFVGALGESFDINEPLSLILLSKLVHCLPEVFACCWTVYCQKLRRFKAAYCDQTTTTTHVASPTALILKLRRFKLPSLAPPGPAFPPCGVHKERGRETRLGGGGGGG